MKGCAGLIVAGLVVIAAVLLAPLLVAFGLVLIVPLVFIEAIKSA